MRKRLKKEEESRRQFQEIARQKDEELKKLRSDMQILEKRVQEEEAAKTNQKSFLVQRDNKIKLIEERLRALQYENEVLRSRSKEQDSQPEKEVLLPVRAAG